MAEIDVLIPYNRAELVVKARLRGGVEESYEEDGIRLRGRLPQGIAAELGLVSL
jgi:hypothetical protein